MEAKEKKLEMRQRLKEFRKELGLKQREIAERLGINVGVVAAGNADAILFQTLESINYATSITSMKNGFVQAREQCLTPSLQPKTHMLQHLLLYTIGSLRTFRTYLDESLKNTLV